jgi:hypothetical protein
MNGQDDLPPKVPVEKDSLDNYSGYTGYGSSKQKQQHEMYPQNVLPQNGYIARVAWRNRRRMAWVSLISMLVATALSFFVVPEHRLKLLGDVITWFYFTMASIVGAYMGFTTWAHIKDQGKSSYGK